MSLLVLLGLFIGLVTLLAFLMFLFFFKEKRGKKREEQKQEIRKKSSYKSLQEYVDMIKDKKSTTADLQNAVDSILKYYGTIHAKLGLRTHPDFDIYAVSLFRICIHPNTNKDIILKFDRVLEKQNPSYKREINNAITKGLNSRVV